MSEARFGSYRALESIGTGALATIYRAVQEPLGRIVAIKALKSQIAPTSSFGEQLDREAKILADLAHPNVVLLLEASRTSAGRPYLVLEHVDGPSLQDLLATFERPTATQRVPKKPTLDVPAALAIACGICAALEHVHEQGIVHRDIKPGNVLISRSGVVKVIDFGIAQRPRTQSPSDVLAEGITPSGRWAPTELKDAFGTPAYMSPEQILGDFVDGRSDLFSLGVVLYQMVCGARPFETASGDDAKRSAAQRIRRDAPPPLRERAPLCPRALERIVMRLLEKAPNDRYPSAGAVRERLEAALRAETREDPASLVRAALAAAGFGPSAAERRDDTSSALPRSVSPRGPAEKNAPARPLPGAKTGRGSIGMARALLGFGALSLLFVLAAAGIEASSGRVREARGAGAHALELAPEHAGGLRVVASPWAYVKVDGQLVETTPFARAIPLTAGRHWVTLSHPDAVSPIERQIDIAPGETVTLDVTLSVFADDAGKEVR
jgi:serine/threonine-protein kinase